MGVLIATVIVSVIAVGAAAVMAFDRAVEPELANRTRLIGSIIRDEIQTALGLGIPFDAIVGLDPYLSATLEGFDEVDQLTVTSASGQTIAAVQRPAAPSLSPGTDLGEFITVPETTFVLPILDGNELVGRITVGISRLFVQRRLQGVFLDVIVIALVAAFIALELALAIAVNSIGKPLDRIVRLLREQRDGNFLHRIRPGGLGGLGRVAARFND
ncbi:MAG: hypothetical protein GY788_11700, partial [bacterium]|nr:hypothetical protein [bacterium]